MGEGCDKSSIGVIFEKPPCVNEEDGLPFGVIWYKWDHSNSTWAEESEEEEQSCRVLQSMRVQQQALRPPSLELELELEVEMEHEQEHEQDSNDDEGIPTVSPRKTPYAPIDISAGRRGETRGRWWVWRWSGVVGECRGMEETGEVTGGKSMA